MSETLTTKPNSVSMKADAGSNHPTNAPVRQRVSEEEWEARVELAALYRLVNHFGWTDGIYTHISLRVPGEFSFLINPFGYLYDEITASSLVKVTVQGEIIDDPTDFGINRAGFVIHGAIHDARHDVACVLHTHTSAGAGVAAQEHGLLPISQHATIFMGRIAYHDFEGIAVDEDEQSRLVADLGSHRAMILRNHGLLTAGRSAGEALFLMSALERACEIQIAALAGNSAVRPISQKSIDVSLALVDAMDGDVTRDWSAMLRLANRIAPDFAR